METNVLGRERIGKLLRAYAIPSIISMLVNALYNIQTTGWRRNFAIGGLLIMKYSVLLS